MTNSKKSDPLDERLNAYDEFMEKRRVLSEKEKEGARRKARVFLVDSSNLDEEVRHVAAMESYISSHYVAAKRNEAMAYLDRKIKQAQKLIEFRSLYKSGRGGKTNDEIEAMVMNDEEIRIAYAAHIAAQMTATDIEGDLAAIRRKAKMLELQKIEDSREQQIITGNKVR